MMYNMWNKNNPKIAITTTEKNNIRAIKFNEPQYKFTLGS